jgi:hypothetical protein
MTFGRARLRRLSAQAGTTWRPACRDTAGPDEGDDRAGARDPADQGSIAL